MNQCGFKIPTSDGNIDKMPYGSFFAEGKGDTLYTVPNVGHTTLAYARILIILSFDSKQKLCSYKCSVKPVTFLTRICSVILRKQWQ